MWKCVPPSNTSTQMTRKTCVIRYSWCISYGDLIWTDLFLDLCLVLAPFLYDIFFISSVTLWHSLGSKFSLVWSRQPIRRKESALAFDLTLPRQLTFYANFKTALEHLVESFWSPHRAHRPPINSEVRHGGDIRSQPSPSQRKMSGYRSAAHIQNEFRSALRPPTRNE